VADPNRPQSARGVPCDHRRRPVPAAVHFFEVHPRIRDLECADPLIRQEHVLAGAGRPVVVDADAEHPLDASDGGLHRDKLIGRDNGHGKADAARPRRDRPRRAGRGVGAQADVKLKDIGGVMGVTVANDALVSL